MELLSLHRTICGRVVCCTAGLKVEQSGSNTLAPSPAVAGYYEPLRHPSAPDLSLAGVR